MFLLKAPGRSLPPLPASDGSRCSLACGHTVPIPACHHVAVCVCVSGCLFCLNQTGPHLSLQKPCFQIGPHSHTLVGVSEFGRDTVQPRTGRGGRTRATDLLLSSGWRSPCPRASAVGVGALDNGGSQSPVGGSAAQWSPQWCCLDPAYQEEKEPFLSEKVIFVTSRACLQVCAPLPQDTSLPA